MGRRTRNAFALLAVALSASLALHALDESTSLVPIHIDVRARALAQGEVVRVLVHADEPLASVRGRLGERELAFVRAGGGENFVAFGVIGIDDEAGTTLLSLSGTTATGREARGERALAIEARAFPTEHLKVESRYVEPPAAVQKRIEADRARTAAVYQRRTARALPESPLVRPVPGGISSPFGKRRVYNGQPRSPHSGVDLRAKTGDPVLAAAPGHVALAADLYFSGNTVILDHGGGFFTIYAHLSRLLVAEGDDIDAGARVGLAGATGRVTGPHLHFGAKIGTEPFDPLALFDAELFSADASD